MGTWGTGLDENDTFGDIYDSFFELYDNGLSVSEITKRLSVEFQETIDEPDDSDNFWFALAKAQWECKALDQAVFLKVKEIIGSGQNLKVWKDLDASDEDLQERKVVLDQILETISVEKSEPRPREKKSPPEQQPRKSFPAPRGRSGINILKLWRWWQWGSYATIGWVFLASWLVNGYFDNLPKGRGIAWILGMGAAFLGLAAVWVFLYRLHRRNQPRPKSHPKDPYQSSVIR